MIDGDTDDLLLDDGGETVRVRLAWVDSPELNQPFGAEAKDWAQGVLHEAQVVLTPKGKAIVGRLVSQVTVGGNHWGLSTAAPKCPGRLCGVRFRCDGALEFAAG